MRLNMKRQIKSVIAVTIELPVEFKTSSHAILLRAHKKCTRTILIYWVSIRSMHNQILISTNAFADEGQTVIRGDEKALKVGTSQEATRWDLGASKPINWVLDHKFKKFRSMSPFRYPSAADAWHDRRRTGNRASRIAPRWLRPNLRVWATFYLPTAKILKHQLFHNE